VAPTSSTREEPLVPTVVIRIDMPPRGIEVTGEGSSPTDEEMDEEKQARQEFIDAIAPTLASLPERPARRAGNVRSVELLGGNVWSELNRYLLLVEVDIGDPGIDLTSLVPAGGEVSVIGSYAPLQRWREIGSA
jgi:hypothetical protein